jgi:hypothetical protein
MLLAKDLTQESDLQNGQKLMVSTRLFEVFAYKKAKKFCFIC